MKKVIVISASILAITIFSSILYAFCKGDHNGDQVVNGADLAQFAPNFGNPACSGNCFGDLDGDGDIDAMDISAMACAFGACSLCLEDLASWRIQYSPLGNTNCIECHTRCTPGGHGFCSVGEEWGQDAASCINCHTSLPPSHRSSDPPPEPDELQFNLIDPGFSSQVDGVELGTGRNDGVIRLYGPLSYEGAGYEWSFENGSWVGREIYSGLGSTHCTPRVGDLGGQGSGVYMGIWSNKGVGMVSYDNGWSGVEIMNGSTGKSRILSIKVGDGRNDGVQRLYIGSDNGLFEYSWNGADYDERLVLNRPVGDFGFGDGRNDGVTGIYAGVRGGTTLHELVWDGQTFQNNVIFTAQHSSRYAAHVGDGRGDGVNRVYAWCGGIYEFTYENGQWTRVTVDSRGGSRFYIRSGRIHSDNRSRLYVSKMYEGLMEYSWNTEQQEFEVDAISGATGGCAIGDGRGDGKNRLYVGRGSNGTYTEAAVVEISSDNPPVTDN